MRVLGIDPGTYSMGVGVVDLGDDGGLTLAFNPVVRPKKSDPLSQRLHYLYGVLLRVIDEWQPAVVAVEEPFVARNVRAAMAIGQAQAVAMMAAANHGLAVSGYSPREVKKSVTDYGGSSKVQVQEMVKVLLGLTHRPEPSDRADALAVAICHINSSRVVEFVASE